MDSRVCDTKDAWDEVSQCNANIYTMEFDE